MNPTQERIKYYTEWIKILWLTLIADVGGVVSLFVGSDWEEKTWLIVAGGLVAGMSVSLIVALHMVIERLINEKEQDRV